MDACADESLYHFTATVGHSNFNKAVHLGGQDRSGFQRAGGGGGNREGSAPRSNPLPFYIPFLTEKVVAFLYLFHWQMLPLSHT